VKHKKFLCMMMALCMMLSVVMMNRKVEAKEDTSYQMTGYGITIGGTKDPVLESFKSYQLEGQIFSDKQLRNIYLSMERKVGYSYKSISKPVTHGISGLRTRYYDLSSMNFTDLFKIENYTPGEYRLYFAIDNVDGQGFSKYIYFSIGFDERTFVHELYRCVLDREPDQKGFDDNLNALTSGRISARGLARAFYQSPEFKKKNLNNDQYVRQLYKGLLGRYPDTEGYNNWMAWLNRGDGDYRDFVLEQFLNSPEFENRCRNFGVNY